MSSILPKGIVKNSAEVEGSIERINTEPLDLADIARFWKVYTTTKRRLLDPTAERLENHWWRIWGSRKRELNGATVAGLFAAISNGESFVPLRGPPNRDDGIGPWKRTILGESGASSTASSSVSKGAGTPHPILKKSRGPSTTGPRPTARFITPHDSGDDPNNDACENTHVVVQPPSPEPEKSSSRNGSRKPRSFVSSPSNKRPVLFRRKSSQSSNESPARSLEAGSSGVESSLESPSPVRLQSGDARNKQVSESKFIENFSPSDQSSRSRNKEVSSFSDSRRLSPLRSELSSPRRAGNSPIEDSKEDLTGSEPGANIARRAFHPETKDDSRPRVRALPKRSQSDIFQGSYQPEFRDARPIRYLSNDVKSTASLAPTLTDAKGQLAASRGTGPRVSKSSSDDARLSMTSMTGPTRPASNYKSTFTRSKSQLELVLERDRSRHGDNKGDRRT